MNRSPNGGARSALVLVVDDDPLVGERIAAELSARRIDVVHVHDFELALELAKHSGPPVLVLDDIVASSESPRLLRALDELGAAAPHVVLLRYDDEPSFAAHGLDVTVVAGEGWMELLPAAVERVLAATSSSIPPRLSHAR